MKKLTIPTAQDVEKAAKSRGWTIKDMCQVAGVADETFSRWKKGRHLIRVDSLQKLLTALVSPLDAVAARRKRPKKSTKARTKKSTVLSPD